MKNAWFIEKKNKRIKNIWDKFKTNSKMEVKKQKKKYHVSTNQEKTVKSGLLNLG